MERKIKASFTTTIIANLVANQVSKLELKKHFMQALSNSENRAKFTYFIPGFHHMRLKVTVLTTKIPRKLFYSMWEL